MKKKELKYFKTIRDYFEIFLPNQKGASYHTIKNYKICMNQFLDFAKDYLGIKLRDFDFNDTTIELVESFLEYGENEYHWSAQTRNLKLAAIRSFYKYSANHDITLIDIYLKLMTIPIKSVTKGTVIDFFSEKELELLLNQPNQSNIKDRRNLAMMITLYDTGARIQELLNIRIKDISLESSPHIAIYGKGKKMRIVPIMDKTVKHLKRYLDDYDLNSDDYVFFTLHHGERTKMNPDTVQKLIDRYCITANNVDSKFPRHIYCHMFRHSRAMHLYRNGMPLPLVSEWLGHAQINTTREFYANADTEMKRKAINAALPVINIIDSSTNNYDFDDEELLKKLYSLK